MALHVEADRVQQIKSAIERFTEGFRPFTETNRKEDFLAILEPDVEWYDHGFFNVRQGHEAVLKLHAGFLYCNQPFRAEIKEMYITQDGAAVQQIWKGCCKNSIIRPDGTAIMKASGKDFETHVGLFIRVSQAGKISKIDEYDHRYWDEGRKASDYTQL